MAEAIFSHPRVTETPAGVIDPKEEPILQPVAAIDPRTQGPVHPGAIQLQPGGPVIPLPAERQNHMLTRRGMEQTIQAGGSFFWPRRGGDGTVAMVQIVRMEDIPSEVEIAGRTGSMDALHQVDQDLTRQIDQLNAQRDRLRSARQTIADGRQAPAAAPAPGVNAPPASDEDNRKASDRQQANFTNPAPRGARRR